MDYSTVATAPTAYRTSEGIICTDPECMLAYVDLLETATPMDDADINDESNNHDGASIGCSRCMEPLDRYTRSGGTAR